MAKAPKIGELTHRIAVTSWREYPDDDVNLLRERKPIFSAWAALKERGFSTLATLAAMDHYQSNRVQVPTHEITIRNPSDVHITGRMWVYVERRHGRRDWFRVLSVKYVDSRERWITILVALDEIDDPRRDPAVLNEPGEEGRPEIDRVELPTPQPRYGCL